MLKKITDYWVVVLSSFVFFSLLFHTVAHAQETTIPQDHPQIATAFDPSQMYPTPTVYIAPPVSTPILPEFLPIPNPSDPSTSSGPMASSMPSARLDSTTASEPPASPTPTDTPTPTPLPPTPTETPTPTIIPTATPTPQPVTTQLSTAGGLNADKLFSMVNTYHQSKGLPALQKDDNSCQLAASRAPEIAGEIASGTMHSGLRNRNIPYWNTENIISMNSEEAAFNWWINDTIHREAIEGNYTYSCTACSGNSCAQEFTNYQPK